MLGISFAAINKMLTDNRLSMQKKQFSDHEINYYHAKKPENEFRKNIYIFKFSTSFTRN